MSICPACLASLPKHETLACSKLRNSLTCSRKLKVAQLLTYKKSWLAQAQPNYGKLFRSLFEPECPPLTSVPRTLCSQLLEVLEHSGVSTWCTRWYAFTAL